VGCELYSLSIVGDDVRVSIGIMRERHERGTRHAERGQSVEQGMGHRERWQGKARKKYIERNAERGVQRKRRRERKRQLYCIF
jgi:hypothetical protein